MVEDKEEEDEAGPVERLQAAVVENINLYSDKYDEEFETYFPKFVTAIWELLLRCPNVPKYDALVTRSMRFLVSVVGKAMHKKLFEVHAALPLPKGQRLITCVCVCVGCVAQDPAKLKQIIEKVVLPNLMLREADEDLFEDNWVRVTQQVLLLAPPRSLALHTPAWQCMIRGLLSLLGVLRLLCGWCRRST